MNTAYIFGIERDVQNMIFRGHLYSRAHWREKLQKRAWELEDIFWCIKSRCHRSLDMLNMVCQTTRYSIWWQLADIYHQIRKDCEVMIEILCHASLLRNDDVRLKSLPFAKKFCPICYNGSVDDAMHFGMQCPELQTKRSGMFNEINQICENNGLEKLNTYGSVFWICMGKPGNGIPIETMEILWACSTRHISDMHRHKLKMGKG